MFWLDGSWARVFIIISSAQNETGPRVDEEFPLTLMYTPARSRGAFFFSPEGGMRRRDYIKGSTRKQLAGKRKYSARNYFEKCRHFCSSSSLIVLYSLS